MKAEATAQVRAAALEIEERLEAAGILQRLLTDSIDLTLQAKQAHWNVRGAEFRSVHRQLDELVEAGRSYSDRLAERCLALGAAADGRAASVASGTDLEPFPEGRLEDNDVVEHIAARLLTVSEAGRSRLARLEQIDPVSQNLVCELLDEIEKQLWMFESSRSLNGRDSKAQRRDRVPSIRS
jgi:starvation-inducible DNA-binding protein